MKILHTSRFYHPHVGGTENYISSLVRATGDSEHEHMVLCSNRYAAEVGPEPQCEVKRVPAIGPDEIPFVPGASLRLLRVLRRIDVVHVHDVRFIPVSLALVARLMQRPIVISTHGLIWHTDNHRRIKRVFAATALKALYRSADVILASSSSDAANVPVPFRPKTILWENPVDVAAYEEIQFRGDNHSKRLVYFGRIDRNKGIEDLLAAIAHRFDIELVIVGRGSDDYLRSLKRIADEGKPPVRFAGYLPEPELADLLARSNVVVLPSRREGFGLVLVEAMASGLPIIANDIPPFRTIAAGSDVALVDFSDEHAVNEAIDEALKRPPSLSNRKRARMFSWASRAPELRGHYAEVTR